MNSNFNDTLVNTETLPTSELTMDTITSTNPKRIEVNYVWRRFLIVFLGLPQVATAYYWLSNDLYKLFMMPSMDHFVSVCQSIIGLPLALLLVPITIVCAFVPLCIYFIVMEFTVLPWIKNKYGVMILSEVACSIFMFFPIFPFGGGFPRSAMGLGFCLAGFMSGLFIGYMLYCSYRKQLEKNNKK